MINWFNEVDKIYDTSIPIHSSCGEVVLYGAGSLGEMACDLLFRAGIKPKYIIDKYANGEINGIKIISPNEVPNSEDALCLICIATIPYNEISTYIESLGFENYIHFYTYAYLKFPHLLLNGWTCYNPSDFDKEQIGRVCELLSHDELSLCHYLQFLWWKIRGIEHIYDKYPVLSGKKYFESPCIPSLGDNTILIDAGCHHGQTIEKFIKITNNRYKNIYAFEPDLENLKICKENFNDERIIYSDRAIYNKCMNAKFSDGLGFASKLDKDGNQDVETVTIDSLNLNPDIIKVHIEGDELKGLEGSVETIRRCHPILMVTADHTPDGLYKIPLFIAQFGYKLYFNLHDYCGNTAVFYAKKEKI